jgi:hypothetical protein
MKISIFFLSMNGFRIFHKGFHKECGDDKIVQDSPQRVAEDRREGAEWDEFCPRAFQSWLTEIKGDMQSPTSGNLHQQLLESRAKVISYALERAPETPGIWNVWWDLTRHQIAQEWPGEIAMEEFQEKLGLRREVSRKESDDSDATKECAKEK